MMIARLIEKMVNACKRKVQFQPYESYVSNIGFKAIGKASEYRELMVTEGRTYIPSVYSYQVETGKYTNYYITIDEGKVIRVVKSDIGTIFKVIPYVRERLMNDETLL